MENKYNRDLYTHGLETYEAEYEKIQTVEILYLV